MVNLKQKFKKTAKPKAVQEEKSADLQEADPVEPPEEITLDDLEHLSKADIKKIQQRQKQKKREAVKKSKLRRKNRDKELKEIAKQEKSMSHTVALIDEDEKYSLKKIRRFRVVRVILWVFVSLIFVRGTIASFRPDPNATVNQTIADFSSGLETEKKLDSEMLAFAENFAVEYMTYESGKESEYGNRLRRYAAETVTNQPFQFDDGASANVAYALAYKKQEYSEHQSDVFVQMSVIYSNLTKMPDGKYATEVSSERTILKVPIAVNGDSYIVEDVPVFVNDNTKIQGYEQVSYQGDECTEGITSGINSALSNFYKSYYEDGQSIINYYLTPDADKSQFMGLNGRVTYHSIESLRAYYIPKKTNEFIVITKVNVTDKNGMIMTQNYNLNVVWKDDRYYIRSMDTRTVNV